MKGDPLLRSLERDPALARLPEKNETAGGLAQQIFRHTC